MSGGTSPVERRILQATLDVLVRRGVRRLSMAEIADVARVSRATVYRYFGTKEALLAQVASFEMQEFSDGLEKVLIGLPEGRARARAAVRYVTVQRNDDKRLRVMADIDPAFVLEYLPVHMPAVRDLLMPSLAAALAKAPAVQAGAMTPDELLDVVMRLQATTWVLPTENRSHLQAAIRWLIEGEAS
jgi:TetR/AcrR family transcriptional regulator, repressor for uid operon